MICQNQRCGVDFPPNHAGRKFCSTDCANDVRRKVDIKRLTRMVQAGEMKSYIARAFGVHIKTVHRWIDEFGLAAEWREHRFAHIPGRAPIAASDPPQRIGAHQSEAT